MNFRQFFKASSGAIIGAIVVALVGLVLCMKEFSTKISSKSYDLLFVRPPLTNVNEVLMIYMDESSYAPLGQKFGKLWDRRLHTALLRKLKALGAKGAVFDVVFSDPSEDPSVDQDFAKAMKELGNVVIAADWTKGLLGKRAGQVSLPTEALMDAVGEEKLGVAETDPDDDIMVRRHFFDPNAPVPTLAWAAAEAFGAKNLPKTELERAIQRWINYIGPADSLPAISYRDALDVAETNKASLAFFKGRMIFIGANIHTEEAAKRKDEYRNPYSAWITSGGSLYMPGVDVQATVFLNLVHHNWLTRLPPIYEHSLILLAGILFGGGLALCRPWYATGIAALAMVGISAGSYYGFVHYHLWWAWLIPVLVQIPIALVYSVIVNSVSLYVGGRLMEQSLSMYVSPARAKQIAKNPKLLQPGAEKQELSILFSDIANFTNISEGMDSNELAAFMNRYFEAAVGECLHPTEGTVVKFIGDAIFAIWNAPEPQAQHCELACRGALLLRDRLKAAEFTVKKGDAETRTRIGLHTGVANVGNFGSSTRVDYTAIGEDINLAARMEGLNKYLGTDLLITGPVFDRVQDKFSTRFCGLFQLKGFGKAVRVYELLGPIGQAAETQAWRDVYAKALDAYKNRQFEQAKELFQKTIEMHPYDGPSQFIMKHLKEMSPEELPDNWSGEIELKEK